MPTHSARVCVCVCVVAERKCKSLSRTFALGNAMRCEARENHNRRHSMAQSQLPQSIRAAQMAYWALSAVLYEISSGSYYTDTGTGREQCYAPTIRRVMHTHPMLVINTYLKFAFGCQCECECVSGSAGNPICGCECYANK